jgi:hypothetical protein
MAATTSINSLLVTICVVMSSTSFFFGADAVVKIVVDIDGAVEDFAVLTTILRHSTAQNQLAVVTVNGNGWGSLKSTEANLKRFLTLAGKIDTVQIGVGAMKTLSNSYNATTSTANCLGGGQGVPRTPQEALSRKMKLSRYDIDRIFGATAALPSASAAALAKSNAATQLLVNLLGSLTTGDTIQFIALKSLTTLASFATSAQQLGLGDQFASIVQIHSYETRGNWALDLDSTNIVFQSGSTSGIARAAKYLYTPQLWQTSVTFSFYYWAQFEVAASTTSASKEVKWLRTAWSSMKTFFDGTSTTSITFFNERGPASSLVALCVVDVSMRALCDKYRSSNTTIAMSWKNTTLSATSSTTGAAAPLTYDYLSGNNITNAMFLQYPATSATSAGAMVALTSGGTAYVFDQSASIQWPNSQILAVMFWNSWISILKQ